VRRRLVWLAVLAVAAAMAVPHVAVADDGNGDEAELHGVVESLPASGLVGDWTVSGTVVHVTDATEINQDDAPAAVGANVEVKGTQESDGSITADEVEVKEAADDDQFGNVEFHGSIESLPDPYPVGDWVVSDRTVHVTDQTVLENDGGDNQGGDAAVRHDEGDGNTTPFAVGDQVEVKGTAEADGSITATRIESDDQGENEDEQGDDDGTVALTGRAQMIAHTAGHVGLWRVSTHPVRVLRSTRIVRNGHTLTRGAHLRVTGRWFAGGTIRATRIAIVR
jgi:cytoskeletal protein CcmA (bactofilin family)